MTGESYLAQLEREAAKFKTTDLLHQSDQSLHYQEIFKAQQGKMAKNAGRMKESRRKV